MPLLVLNKGIASTFTPSILVAIRSLCQKNHQWSYSESQINEYIARAHSKFILKLAEGPGVARGKKKF